MAIDDGLRGGPIVVETGRRHGLLDVADGVLALGDPGLEIVDSCAARLRCALQAARFRSITAAQYVAYRADAFKTADHQRHGR